MGMRLMMSGYFPVLSSWFLLKIFTSPPSRTWIYHHREGRESQASPSCVALSSDPTYTGKFEKLSEILHRSEQIILSVLVLVTCVWHLPSSSFNIYIMCVCICMLVCMRVCTRFTIPLSVEVREQAEEVSSLPAPCGS